MNTPNLQIIVKGVGDSSDVVKLIVQMFTAFGIIGQVTIRVGYEIRGSSETRGIQVKQASMTDVAIAVQPSDNGSRRECALTWHGQVQKKLRDLLLRNLAGKKYFRPEDYERRPTIVVPMPALAPAAEKPVTAVPAEPTLHTPAPAEVPETASLHGFTGGDGTNVLLLLSEIREKHGSGEISTERFYQIMKDSGLCGGATSNYSMGQIIRWLCEEGYFEHRSSKGVDFYKISARGDELLVEKIREAETVAKRPAFAPYLLDPQKIQAGIMRLMADIEKIDEAARQLKSVQALIAGCDGEIAALKKQIDPVIARRDGLAEQAKHLEETLTNPQFMASREKLRALEAAVGQLLTA